MKLSWTFSPYTPIQNKIGRKILSQNLLKQGFIANFQLSKTFVDS